MHVTTILKNEHRVIEQVLSCLEKMAEQAVQDERIDEAPARDAVAFFRNFADRCHHGKEEDRLFPAMESRGIPSDAGPTFVMRTEHVQGRELVGRIASSIEGAAAGRAAELQSFVDAARSYVELLREHIEKEDHCLFPMAEQVLEGTDEHELLESFRVFEHDEMGAGAHEKFHAIADALADRYGVPRAELTPVDACCC